MTTEKFFNLLSLVVAILCIVQLFITLSPIVLCLYNWMSIVAAVYVVYDYFRKGA